MERALYDADILIVEDSPTQAIMLQETLNLHGFRTLIAHSAEDALATIRAHQPTIVISDIMMPGMDGYELCRQIKADDTLKSIPVILLTALSDPQDVVRGLDSGADNFFVKSHDESSLLSSIRYILANLELRKQTTAEMSIEIFFAGKRHSITASRVQIIDLLFSTFDNAVQKNAELERTNRRLLREIAERKRMEKEREKLITELETALAHIKTLRGMLPICASCKKVRDDQGYWHQVEAYIRDHSEAEITHGICPECARKLYPDFFPDESLAQDNA